MPSRWSPAQPGVPRASSDRPQLGPNGWRVAPSREKLDQVTGLALEALHLARELGGPGVMALEDCLELGLTIRASASIMGAVIASRNLASMAPSSRFWRSVPCVQTAGPLVLANPHR